jgi:hypothetical protein
MKLLGMKDTLFNDTVPTESASDSAGSGQGLVAGFCQHVKHLWSS